MRAFVFCFLISGLLLPSIGYCQGAIAVDDVDPRIVGVSYGEGSQEQATRTALRQCGDSCTVVLAFDECAAYAASNSLDAGAEQVGLSIGDSKERATSLAIAQCAANGGAQCRVIVSGCNPSVARAIIARGYDESAPQRPIASYGDEVESVSDNDARLPVAGNARAQESGKSPEYVSVRTVEARPADSTQYGRADDDGIPRKPGPSCVKYSEYADNCKTEDERRATMGLPSIAQERQNAIDVAKAEQQALAAKSAGPDESRCLRKSYSSYQQSTGQITPLGASYETEYRTIYTNICKYSVRFEFNDGWGFKDPTRVTLAPQQQYGPTPYREAEFVRRR